MSQIHKLTTSKNLIRGGDNTKGIDEVIAQKIDTVISGDLSFQGKTLYRISELFVTEPKTLEEVDARILMIIPSEDWQKVCKANNFKRDKTKHPRRIKERYPNMKAGLTTFALMSQPYSSNDKRVEAFAYVMEEANNDLSAVLELIEKKRDSQTGEITID